MQRPPRSRVLLWANNGSVVRVVASLWSLTLVARAEFAKARAAADRHERLRYAAPQSNRSAVGNARRVYVEFYANAQHAPGDGRPPDVIGSSPAPGGRSLGGMPVQQSDLCGGARMKLYFRPGASSLFPHIVLIDAGLTFEALKVDEHTKTLEDGRDYRMVNPLGYVPALEFKDGTVLTEAVAIAQYAADLVPSKRLAPPNGTLERVRLQSWLNFISAEIHVGSFCPLFDPVIPDVVKLTFRRRLHTRFAFVERHLAGNTILLGNEYSIGDVYLFVVSRWAGSADFDLTPYPQLRLFRKRVRARPAVEEAMAAGNVT